MYARTGTPTSWISLIWYPPVRAARGVMLEPYLYKVKALGDYHNGAPSGVPDCSEAGCMISEEYEVVHRDGHEEMVKKQRCIRTIHAEQNLLLFTDRIDREGSSVYVTDQPCWTCANMLANSGIVEIVYHRPYPKDADKVRAMMEEKGIAFRMLKTYHPPKETLMDVMN